MKRLQTQEEAQEHLLLVDLVAQAEAVPDEYPSPDSNWPLGSQSRSRVARVGPAQLRRAVRAFATASMLEADRGAMFLLAPVMLCIGGLVFFSAPFQPGWPLVLAPAALSLIVAWFARHRAVLGAVAISATLLFSGALAAKIETWRVATRVIGGEITTRLTGRVEQVEHRKSGRVRLTLAVLATERPKLRYQPDRVRLTARKTQAGVQPGSIVTGVARLSQPLGPLRPGGYDFAFENYFDGIGATGFFLRDPTQSTHPASEPGMLDAVSYAVENMRNALAKRVRDRIDGEAGEIAAALIAGARAGIPEQTNEVLRITGLAHVLSISGLHMALVAGVVIGAMRFGFALFPAFASNYPVRKFAAAGALVAVAIYLLISGAAIAAQRSFLMIAIMLAAMLFDHAALTMRNLAVAALVILALAPHEAAGPSFQMSFAATAALIAAYAWWQERRNAAATVRPTRSGIAPRLIRNSFVYAAGLAATALIAGSATGIFGAWHFQRVSPLGLPANLLTMPIVSVMVMPFAVLGVLLIPLQLDGPAFWVMGTGLEWMIAIAAWLAARTPIDAIGAVPAATIILLAMALVPLTLATTLAWRATAIPLVVLGIASLTWRTLPLAFVSEDARLIAVRMGDGRASVNRSRPNPFIIKDWRRAMMAADIVKPAEVADDAALFAVSTGFACRDGLCVATRTGLTVAHARDMARAETACGKVDVIVIEDATSANPCPHSPTRVVTAQQLALRGSVEIRRGGEVVFALPKIARPWHDHRRFSRAARGMPPYVPQSKRTAASRGPTPGRPFGAPAAATPAAKLQ